MKCIELELEPDIRILLYEINSNSEGVIYVEIKIHKLKYMHKTVDIYQEGPIYI